MGHRQLEREGERERENTKNGKKKLEKKGKHRIPRLLVEDCTKNQIEK